ncbi:MAG: 50S ribosomal protein L17 [Verrucomicrobiota bacterium]
MRHRSATATLGMKSQHRRAVLANLVCSLIEHNRITTTIAKAKEARKYADKMITLAKGGTLHQRRQALAFLRQQDLVKKLFADLGKQHSDRQGGYTRIIRVGQRHGDAAHMAILEWTGTVLPAPAPETGKAAEEAKPTAEATTEAKPKAKRAAKKPAAEKTDAK